MLWLLFIVCLLLAHRVDPGIDRNGRNRRVTGPPVKSGRQPPTSATVSEFEWVQGRDLVTFHESSRSNFRGAGFAVHRSFPSLPALRIMAWRSEPLMTTQGFDLSSMFTSRAKRHGLGSRMTSRNFQSVQRNDPSRGCYEQLAFLGASNRRCQSATRTEPVCAGRNVIRARFCVPESAASAGPVR
jgi:hypothetical protein